MSFNFWLLIDRLTSHPFMSNNCILFWENMFFTVMGVLPPGKLGWGVPSLGLKQQKKYVPVHFS